jgi:hypothetical protein
MHSIMWKYSYKELKWAQILDQRGVFLTSASSSFQTSLCIAPTSARGTYGIDGKVCIYRSPCIIIFP